MTSIRSLRCEMWTFVLTSLFLAAITAAQDEPAGSVRLDFQRQAEALRSTVKSDWVAQFLQSTKRLPAITSRTILVNKETRTYFTTEEAASLPEADRSALEPRTLDETFYYTSRYGTPLAYSRAFDLVALSGVGSVNGLHILDFGYGAIGHLKLMAMLGADAVGIEVDPLLKALYSQPGDQGRVEGEGGVVGNVRLVHGRWPAEESAKSGVGGGYDLIISKNTLKNGYIHPAQEVDPRMLVNLGVDDETYVRALFAALNPGGRVMIYNLCPAPAPPDKPYIPWADGRSPFSRELYEKCGFKIIAFDQDDSEAARAMGRALGWDQGTSPMDLQNDLFAWYTLIQKP